MEFVDGEPLDLYCDRLKLKVEARLVLFEQVLDAVDAAHRNLVVHRDLKPSNILVNREGMVKLLDFGTSKLLADDATITGMAALTPGYASPEQLRGEPAATTADVFSLGIVLFKLLAGGDPFGGAGSFVSSLDRAHRETHPLRPETLPDDHVAEARSTTAAQLRKRLRDDLGSILRKALAHDPSLRYPSVASFTEDLRRYKEQRPVLARRHNWTYRCERAIRRHARAVAAAAAFVVGLAGAALFSVRQAHIAQREAERARAANRFLTEIFEIPIKDSSSHHDLTVRELLDLAEKRVIPLLGADPAVAADVDYVLGGGLLWQGAIPQARHLLTRAVDHARKAEDVPREAAATARLSYVSYAMNQHSQAWTEALAALGLWKSHRSRFTSLQSVGVLHEAATTLLYIRPSDPIHREYFEQGLALARRHPKQVPSSALALCLQKMGESYINVDRQYQNAHAMLSEAVSIIRSHPLRSDLLLLSLQSFGRVNRFMGRFSEDEKAQREAYEVTLRLNGASTPQTINQHAIWAQSLLGAGRLEEAYDHSRQALADMRRLMPTRGSPLLWTSLSSALNAACLLQRFEECEALAREAIETLGPDPAPNDLRLIDATANLGLSLAGQGRGAAALPLIERVLELNDSLKRKPLYTVALEAARKKVAH